MQSENYHDSHAHSHEQYGPFTLLVRIWLGWICWVGVLLVWCATPVRMVLGLATGGMPVSVIQFWLQV
jgi:hypothetical protein